MSGHSNKKKFLKSENFSGRKWPKSEFHAPGQKGVGCRRQPTFEAIFEKFGSKHTTYAKSGRGFLVLAEKSHFETFNAEIFLIDKNTPFWVILLLSLAMLTTDIR